MATTLALVVLAGEVLRPAILWNDQRTAAECDLIREAVGGVERLVAITGNDALTGFTAPKLVWIRDNEPDIWAQIAHVLLPKDYVRLRLEGEHAIDAAIIPAPSSDRCAPAIPPRSPAMNRAWYWSA